MKMSKNQSRRSVNIISHARQVRWNIYIPKRHGGTRRLASTKSGYFPLTIVRFSLASCTDSLAVFSTLHLSCIRHFLLLVLFCIRVRCCVRLFFFRETPGEQKNFATRFSVVSRLWWFFVFIESPSVRPLPPWAGCCRLSSARRAIPSVRLARYRGSGDGFRERSLCCPALFLPPRVSSSAVGGVDGKFLLKLELDFLRWGPRLYASFRWFSFDSSGFSSYNFLVPTEAIDNRRCYGGHDTCSLLAGVFRFDGHQRLTENTMFAYVCGNVLVGGYQCAFFCVNGE